MAAIAQVPNHVNRGPEALRQEMHVPIVMRAPPVLRGPHRAFRVQKESSQTRKVLCVQIAPLDFFNRRKESPVRVVLNALSDGNKKTKELRFATTLVASNLKIAATTNIGYPTNFPTKMQDPKQVVKIAQMVGRASDPLAKRVSVRCLGGGKYRKTKEILRRMQSLQNVCFHPRASVAGTQIYLIGTQKQQPFQPRIPF
jgi:hypothetical protein